MLAADGHVKVVDFGLALAIDEPHYDDKHMGTSMYMAQIDVSFCPLFYIAEALRQAGVLCKDLKRV